MNLPLSVLDLVPLGKGVSSAQAIENSLDLVQTTDLLGYTRHWFAEHHNMPTIASTTPEIMIALAGEKTERIRVGSGGVMLPNHAPLKVAEAFKMLEARHPGRVDLGIGRAPGTDPATAAALRGGRHALGADDFPQQLSELLQFGTHQTEPQKVSAVPSDVEIPPIWLLGSSDYSAKLSAQLGMGFGFAAHFSDYPPEIPMRVYRERFQPGFRQQPHAILTLSVICAETDEEAERLASSLFVAFARLRTGQPSVMLPPEEALSYVFSPIEQSVVNEIRGRQIMGAPAKVKERIERIAEATQADEIMISTFIHGHEERKRSYELLAEQFLK